MMANTSAVNDNMVVFGGTANPTFAENVADALDRTLGKAEIRRFSDGEIFVEIKENVRGREVFFVQSTCAPANQNLMELLICIDAARRASAENITAVIPYFGYARQDRKVQPRTPITAKLVADLIAAAGADRVLTMDLHAGQIQGFFNIPVDNLYALPVLLSGVEEVIPAGDMVVVSPDAGGVERARAFAKRLDAGLAIIDKRRPKANQAEIMHIIGEVEGRTMLIVDDMVDTAGTLTQAANALKEHGAKDVFACASHGVLSGPAVQRINDSALTKLIVTDSIPLSEEAAGCDRIKQVSVAPLIADAITRINSGSSISVLFA